MLLSWEIFTPSRRALKSLSLHRCASTRCLTLGHTGSKAIPAPELVEDRTHSYSTTQKGEPLGNCVSKEV